MTEPARYDAWLDDTGPAAVVLRQPLVPVEGPDGVIFPATYAAPEEARTKVGSYNIDTFSGETNVCLIDSVGSQANRIEPLFGSDLFAGLVPKVVVEAGEKRIDILEAGHRAGDALIRCSSLGGELRSAFDAVLVGNAEPLARLAPTSLVFGVWDSRGTQAKVPRLVASTIRAYDVKSLTRSATYIPPVEYVQEGYLAEAPDKKTSDLHAKLGFVHVPASGAPGGVIAREIRRDATLSLAALRLLAVRESGRLSTDRTRDLRRYILGLALVALTARQSSYLRQGCNLVPDPDRPSTLTLVNGDGQRQLVTLPHEEALAFARSAAAGFGIGPDRTGKFEPEAAKRDIAEAAEGKSKKSRKKPK